MREAAVRQLWGPDRNVAPAAAVNSAVWRGVRHIFLSQSMSLADQSVKNVVLPDNGPEIGS